VGDEGAKIGVECDEDTTVPARTTASGALRGRIAHMHDVVPGFSERFYEEWRDALVGRNFKRRGGGGSSRSRTDSAAYSSA
jgi:hypothetical protein